jgi:pilus assembly protein Flp/PilA
MNKLFLNKKQEKGQGLVEYAIILALIAIVTIGVMTTLGKKTCNAFSSIGNSLDGGTSSACSSVAAAPTAIPATAMPVSIPVTITCPSSGAVDVKNMSGGPNGASFNCAAGSSYTYTVTGQTSGTILQFRNMYPPYNAVYNYTVP